MPIRLASLDDAPAIAALLTANRDFLAPWEPLRDDSWFTADGQRAAIAALTGPQEPVAAMRDAFDRRRRAIVDGLNAIPGFVTPTPEGAFYVYPDVTALLGREWAGATPTTTLELADLILEHAEVAVVPGEAFGPSGYLRLSYALGDDDIAEGVARLARFFS